MSAGRNPAHFFIDGIEADVMQILRGTSNYTVRGVIKSGGKLHINGTGKVVIDANIEKGAQLSMRGEGEVVFTKRPPEAVVDGIKRTGNVKMIMPERKLINKAQFLCQSGVFSYLGGLQAPASLHPTSAAVIEQNKNNYKKITKTRNNEQQPEEDKVEASPSVKPF